MKTKLLFLITIVLSHFGYAQLSDAVNGVNAYGMAIHGTDIYIADPFLFPNNIISKVDLSGALPATPTTVSIPIGSCVSLTVSGTDLYFGNNSDIFKIDLTQPLPITPTPVFTTSVGAPSNLTFNGNDLYYTDNGGNTIYKIDITAPMETLVATTGGQTFGMTMMGTELYVSSYTLNTIEKFDLTQPLPLTATTVATGFNSPSGLLAIGSDLYIADNLNHKVVKVDLNASLPTTPTDYITTGLLQPYGLTTYANDMYIFALGGSKVWKYTDGTLDVSGEALLNNTLSLYPTPNNGRFTLVYSGQDALKSATIMDVTGKLIQTIDLNALNREQTINLENATSGLYFVEVETTNSKVVLKTLVN